MRFWKKREKDGESAMWRYAKYAVVAVCVIGIGANSISVIPTGYTGVKSTFGKISEKELTTGIHISVPFVQHIQTISNKQQDRRCEGKIWGETSDKTPVYGENVTVRGKKNMAYTIDGKLKVAVSSRALFQLEKEDEIFLKKGKEAYEKYQVKHEKAVLQPGAAFPVVKALLELGEDDVEVIVVSRNTADTSLRVFNSIQAHGLNICRGFFTGGESIINYLKSLDIDLYLTANDDSAKAAIDNGIPAATMITSAAKYMTEATELRVAFDGDAVLFGDESEAVFKSEGLEAFGKNESEKANIPMKEGPMAKFLRALSKIQTKQEKEGKESETKIVTALVTARSAPAHARTIKTLRAWGIKVNQAFFLGGLDKTYVLREFKPQIFFDDQHVHTDRASLVVPAGTVPYKSDSVLAKPKEEEKKGEK